MTVHRERKAKERQRRRAVVAAHWTTIGVRASVIVSEAARVERGCGAAVEVVGRSDKKG